MSEELDLNDYAFDLPPAQIAQQPPQQRDAARLLHLDRNSGAIRGDCGILDLPELLSPGDLLVVNATRVLSARLHGQKSTGGRAEALLLGPDPSLTERHYRALVRSGGHLRPGLRFQFGAGAQRLDAEIVSLHSGGEVTLAFEAGPDPLCVGEAPLPPYIQRDPRNPAHRDQREQDLERYQTVYARAPGAVAAPTAGLHLTQSLLGQLSEAGIAYAEVVLHVGLGTFRPIGQTELQSGRLHAERYELPESTARAVDEARARGGRVIAVGTTTTRVLEARANDARGVEPGRGQTDLFIRPGFGFRAVDGLITNFHLPRSSLLLLVAALAGRKPILAAYRHAVSQGYRFYSFGDAMLIL